MLDGPPRHADIWLEPSPRRVRAVALGQVVARSGRMQLLFEPGRRPAYLFPRADVRMELLTRQPAPGPAGPLGAPTLWDLAWAGQTIAGAAYGYYTPRAGAPELSGLLGLRWDAMEAWYEEDEQIFVHARDPYKRVDVLDGSRHIRVALDGVTLAETRRPRLLFETGLPTRYYIPPADVDWTHLSPSTTRTACPYKGEASYHDVLIDGRRHADLVWYYPYPVLNCAKLAGHLCFFNEKLDIHEDGMLLPRPQSPWS
jgi:uncharacterized protein (DUF427 family)